MPLPDIKIRQAKAPGRASTGRRASVEAKLRLMVKRIVRKYKYPPDRQVAGLELVLQQAKALGEAWA